MDNLINDLLSTNRMKLLEYNNKNIKEFYGVESPMGDLYDTCTIKSVDYYRNYNNRLGCCHSPYFQ